MKIKVTSTFTIQDTNDPEAPFELLDDDGLRLAWAWSIQDAQDQLAMICDESGLLAGGAWTVSEI